MTNEELERAIEFLLKNQADFDARMQRFEAAQSETGQQIRELATGQQHTQENLASLTEIVARNSQDIARNTQQIGHLGEVMASVVEGQQGQKDDIDALIKLVGGLIEGRGNGKSES